MDMFVEKIVKRGTTPIDYLIITGIIIGGIILCLVSFLLPYGLGLFACAGIIYFAYLLITSRRVEYEYSVTNGEIDIDKIISQRKRKRIFSCNCKEFDTVAKVSDEKFKREITNVNIVNKIEAVTYMGSPNTYFITLNYKGARTIVYFEPDVRMLESFKLFIPRKVFI